MLYNALHIGDQIVSIGGITITNAKEANKTINNSTGQFVSAHNNCFASFTRNEHILNAPLFIRHRLNL